MLQRLHRFSCSHRARQRAHCILLSSQGRQINDLAQIFGVHRNAISAWIDAWSERRLAGLYDQARCGRPPLLSADDHDRLKTITADHPLQSRVIHAEFQTQTGQTCSLDTVKRALKKIRATVITAPDALYAPDAMKRAFGPRNRRSISSIKPQRMAPSRCSTTMKRDGICSPVFPTLGSTEMPRWKYLLDAVSA